MNIEAPENKTPFLSGGGEMGALMRANDWSETSLGNPETWPISLQTTIDIMLHSAFPMFVFWGKELICFYNDAFRPSLGANGKHPAIGKKGKEVWAEIWHFIGPLIDQVMTTGTPVWFENQLVPFYRNGRIEDIYWTFSYSPVNDESGKPAGVFVTCSETTEKVVTRKRIEESERRLKLIILQAPVAIAIFRGGNYVVEIANKRALELWGRKEEEVTNKPILESMPELAMQGIKKMLDDVYQSGNNFSASELPVQVLRNGEMETAYVNFVYEALYDIDGKINGVMIVGTEVTSQINIRNKIEESEKEFRQLADSLPGLVWTTNAGGAQTFASKRWREFTGIDPFDEKTFREVVHPDDFENIVKTWTACLSEGKTYKTEVRLKNKNQQYEWFYVNGEPIKNKSGQIEKWAGVFTNINVQKKTEKKLAQAFQLIEENEKKLKIIIGASELGTWDLDLITDQVNCSDKYLEIFGYQKGSIVSHKELIRHLHPENLAIRHKALNEALITGSLYYQSKVIWDDKSIHFIEVKGKVFYNDQKKPVHIIGTVRDITKEKLHEQGLMESEQTLRLLADSMPQLIWTGDAGGNLNYYNQSVFDYSGLTLEEINKNGWIQIVHPDDREENIRQWQKSITTGKDFIFEHRFRKHDGEYRWHLSRAMSQKDAEGKIQMWVGTSTDIQDQKMLSEELEKKIEERTVELKQINEELKKSEEKYHLMVSEVQDYAILYLNRNGVIENWNKGAEKIKGYKADEIVGKNFSIFYPEEDKKNNLPQELLQLALTTGRAMHEGWRRRKDGSLFWGSIVITALHNSVGQVIGFSKVTRDLTEKKKADEEIKKKAAELEQKNKELLKMNAELKSFAYVSSHDLQEPLRKIQTFSTLILEKESQHLSDSGKDYFQRMQLAAKRMQILIDDLLSYSRSSTVVEAFVNTDLNEMMAEVKIELKEKLEQKHAIIESKGICRANIIPFQFKQMMLNLIGNSIKFSKPGILPLIKVKYEMLTGSETTIESLLPQKMYCHITVSDNGIGFDQKYADRIFEVFQRLHGKDQYEGTGIGLAIVKKIVENHNGLIVATGEVGKEARFDIYLPA